MRARTRTHALHYAACSNNNVLLQNVTTGLQTEETCLIGAHTAEGRSPLLESPGQCRAFVSFWLRCLAHGYLCSARCSTFLPAGTENPRP